MNAVLFYDLFPSDPRCSHWILIITVVVIVNVVIIVIAIVIVFVVIVVVHSVVVVYRSRCFCCGASLAIGVRPPQRFSSASRVGGLAEEARAGDS